MDASYDINMDAPYNRCLFDNRFYIFTEWTTTATIKSTCNQAGVSHPVWVIVPRDPSTVGYAELGPYSEDCVAGVLDDARYGSI